MVFARCRKGLHLLTPGNRGAQRSARGGVSWFCRACRNARRNLRRRLAKGGVLLDAATRSARISAGRKAAWARQRAEGYTGREAAAAALTARRAVPRRWCRRGVHRWVTENLLDNGRRKTCRWCARATDRARAERQLAAQAQTATRERLWQARIAAHPDRGGSVEAFVAAETAWRRFTAEAV